MSFGIREIGEIYKDNPACKKTNVTFRIMGDVVLKPDEITNSLQIKPTRAFAKGEEYMTKRVGIRYWSIGHWSISTETFVDSTSTEVHAKYLLNLLEPRIKEIVPYLENPLFHTSIVFWWEATDEHGGYTLSSNTLARLCCLCNELDYTFIG